MTKTKKEFQEKFCNNGEFLYNRGGYPAKFGEVWEVVEKLLQQQREEIVGAWEKAEKHGILPYPNIYGNSVNVLRHNEVIREMRGIFLRSLKKGETK